MPARVSPARLWVTAAVLALSILAMRVAGRTEKVPPHRPLQSVPLVLGAWEGEERPLEQRLVEASGADNYLSRIYRTAGGNAISLYVGFYESQRTGDTIHSPKNCLPGAGWEPIRSARVAVQLAPGQIAPVNEYLVGKGRHRQLVMYWYQSRGRVVASEYSAKVWLVYDAMIRNRTDGALVRLVTPITATEADARAILGDFAREFYPVLQEFVPR